LIASGVKSMAASSRSHFPRPKSQRYA
jgi:hypothetical protein